MGICVFILLGYFYLDEVEYFGSRVLLKMKICFLLEVYGCVLSEILVILLGKGVCC